MASKQTDEQADMTGSAMKLLADHIEDYLEVLTDVFIIPDHLKSSEKRFNEACRTVKKLIRKLRDGDTSVFRDPEDWDRI